MREFPTYQEARAEAQAMANRAKVISAYVAKPTAFQGYTVGYLPSPKNRCGWELRVEVVDSEVAS